LTKQAIASLRSRVGATSCYTWLVTLAIISVGISLTLGISINTTILG
jgi:hypothetical protein